MPKKEQADLVAAPLRLLIAGGTGDIGRAATEHLRALGHQVTVLTRTPASASGPAIGWDDPGLAGLVATSDGLINLAGESIWTKRWTRRRKQIIADNRLNLLRRLLDLMGQKRRPGVFVNASGIAFYGTRRSRDIPDESAAAGEGFLAELCCENEALVDSLMPVGVRTTHLRIGVTLSRTGVALRKLSRLQKYLCSGRIGSGGQWFSWIHIADVVGLITFALTTTALSGPCNVTAPEPVTFDTLMAALSERLNRPRCLPVPSPLVRLALGEAAEIVLQGNRVLPHRAISAGYAFRFATLDSALADLMS